MNCENDKSLLSEYADGRLDGTRRAQVEAHLAQCAPCAALLRDFQTTGGLLRGLPVSQTSSQFEARLAERLAQSQSSKTFRLGGAGVWTRPQFTLWRPALALSAAAAAVVCTFFLGHPAVVTPPGQAPVGALVTQCVKQHRSYVSAQPLSDLAAQNLANQLDETSGVSPSTQSSVGDNL
jgi:anti-sigma factor RsiW